MMRTIKFRGENAEKGTIEYGYLVVYETGQYSHWLITPGMAPNVPVKPETISQLVGFDVDGNEVYEGDKIKFGNKTLTAQLSSSAKFEDGQSVLYVSQMFRKVEKDERN